MSGGAIGHTKSGEWLAGNVGRNSLGRRDRVVLLSRGLDGWLRVTSKATDAFGPHIFLWPRLLEPYFRSYGQPIEFTRLEPGRSLDFPASGCYHDADLLLSDRLESAASTPIPNSRRGRCSRNSDHFGRLVAAMKLGLIAMSGVRAHNPELTALGLTLPGFVERNNVIASLPSLGLLTLAGLTPNSIDTSYLEVSDIADVTGVPKEFDAVAISSFSAQIHEAYELADRYRALGTKVILGGLHVSAVPNEARAHADAIVVGEGEGVWPQIMADLTESTGKLREVYDARGVSFDLNRSPMPRFELLAPERYNRLTVQTQRGCPFRCEFCAASMRISSVYKTKPVERVIAEIRAIKSLWKRPFIEFADDNTFVNKTHGKQLVRALAQEGVRWFTETDISVADDLELLDLMKDSGCAQVLIGLESTSPKSLNGLEQRANWKAKQLDQYMDAIRRIQDRGITVNGCFVLGLDGSGPESFEDIWKFVCDSGLYEVQITVQTAFPGTPLYDRLKSDGRLLREEAWELCTLFDVNFHPERMTVAELEAGLRDLGSRIYSAEFTAERRSRFHENYRHSRRQTAPSSSKDSECR